MEDQDYAEGFAAHAEAIYDPDDFDQAEPFFEEDDAFWSEVRAVGVDPWDTAPVGPWALPDEPPF